MTTATTRPATQPTAALNDDNNVVHIVGDFQHWLDRLGLKIPRALCGVSFEGDLDRPDPSPTARTCPGCARADGSV